MASKVVVLCALIAAVNAGAPLAYSTGIAPTPFAYAGNHLASPLAYSAPVGYAKTIAAPAVTYSHSTISSHPPAIARTVAAPIAYSSGHLAAPFPYSAGHIAAPVAYGATHTPIAPLAYGHPNVYSAPLQAPYGYSVNPAVAYGSYGHPVY